MMPSGERGIAPDAGGQATCEARAVNHSWSGQITQRLNHDVYWGAYPSGAERMTNHGRILVRALMLGLGSACIGEDLRDAVRDGSVMLVKSLLESGADANAFY